MNEAVVVGLLGVVLALVELTKWILKRGRVEETAEARRAFWDMKESVDKLYEWHDKEHTPGQKAWYIPAELGKDVSELKVAIKDLHREVRRKKDNRPGTTGF